MLKASLTAAFALLMSASAVASQTRSAVPMIPPAPTALAPPTVDQASTYLVFLDSGTAYAQNGDTGRIDYQDANGDAAALLRNLIAPGRRVFMRAGDYALTDLTPNGPLVMTHEFTLQMESGVVLHVPDGYLNEVFLFSDVANGERLIGANLIGGEIAGSDTVSNPVWTGIRFKGGDTSFGVTRNTVRDTQVSQAGVGIDLLVTDEAQALVLGWIVGNTFDGVSLFRCTKFVTFRESPEIYGVGTPGGIHRNLFLNVFGQAHPTRTLMGFEGIRHRGNAFLGTTAGDIYKNPLGVPATVDDTATDTIILAGNLAGANFDDQGSRTQIIGTKNACSLQNLKVTGDADPGNYFLDVTHAGSGSRLARFGIPLVATDAQVEFANLTSAWAVGVLADGSFGLENRTGMTPIRPLVLEAGAPDEALHVDSTGQVGVGTATPAYALDVNGKVSATGYITQSSRRWKQSITTLEGALETVCALRGVSYTRKQDGRTDLGFVAEEVRSVLPQIVAVDPETDEVMGVDYARVTAILVEGLKEQQRTIEDLAARIADLEARLSGK